MSARRFAGWCFLAVLYLFLLAPAVMVVVDSFNSATSFPGPFESATLHWYGALFQHDEFLTAMRVSSFVAAAAAGLATCVSFFAAYALVRYSFRGKNALQAFLLGPLFVPQIVIGLAMLQMLSLLRLQIALSALIVVHTVYVMPFTLRLIMTALARFDFNLEDAAHSLGAGALETLWHVTLPLARTGIVAGFVFAFILSFVNLPLSLFLTNSRTATLPVVMFSYMESRIDPLVAAAATLMVAGAISFTMLLERVFRFRLLG
ncbi:MAG TPA: ABC transporter permease [Candidatus Acidoferrales bacterium]|jgi:putative spermidine/putrescine transport system permease protein|nr:ABC transporter permease [Candidatus Acidoferrales bacterium]